MKIKKYFVLGLVLAFININVLPVFAITDKNSKNTDKQQLKKEKMLQHKVKRSKKIQ